MDIEKIIVFIRIKKKNQIINMIRGKEKIIQEEKKETMTSRWTISVIHLEIKMMIFQWRVFNNIKSWIFKMINNKFLLSLTIYDILIYKFLTFK